MPASDLAPAGPWQRQTRQRSAAAGLANATTMRSKACRRAKTPRSRIRRNRANGRNRQECPFCPHFKPPCSPSFRRQGALTDLTYDTIHVCGSCYWQDLDSRRFYQKAQFLPLVLQVRLQVPSTHRIALRLSLEALPGLELTVCSGFRAKGIFFKYSNVFFPIAQSLYPFSSNRASKRAKAEYA